MTYQQYLSDLQFANQCNTEYYQNHRSIIPDATFDSLLLSLEQFEHDHPNLIHPDSPTRHVGSDIPTSPTLVPDASPSGSTFRKVPHSTPMLSLAKAYTHDEVLKWRDGIASQLGHKPRLACEYKYDGLSISLKYEEGELVQALTRGDGHEGADVTANVLAMRGFPKHFTDFNVAIPRRFEVRGEILLSFSSFDYINKVRASQGEELYANPRNAASGILHCQDASKRNQMTRLSLFAWQYMPEWDMDMLDSTDHLFSLQTLRSMGFNVAGLWEALGDASINKCIDNITASRDSLKFPIDGVVFKVADKREWSSFGSTDHHPLHSIAYKFPATVDHGTIQTTCLRSIEFSLANSGRVTPVAIADAVQLYGTTVKRYDLSSYNLFQSQGPWHIGDTLTVTKAGETRPKILSNAHDGTGTLITFPKTCPCCNTPLSIEGAYAFCRNPKCRHQLFTPEVQRQANAEALMSDLFPSSSPSIPSSSSPSSLSSLHIVVSGTFSSPSRKLQIKELVKKHAHLQSQVNGKTTHLLAGTGVGPSKHSEALRLGVQIITEQQFLSMLG